MKIKKIHINGYGKFKNKEISFKDGFNVVYGKNESGKSTIISFIKHSLFGFDQKSKDSEGRLSDLKKYQPWNTDEYSGSLEIEKDNTEELRIEKDFDEKIAKIFNVALEDITIEYPHKTKTGVLFGESLFNMDKETFENSAFIKQNETRVYKNKKEKIFEKIINISESGEESTSISKASKVIENAILELGNPRTKNRIYNKTIDRLNGLEDQLKSLKEKRAAILLQQEEVNTIKEDISSIDEQIINCEKEKQNVTNSLLKNKLLNNLEKVNQYEENIDITEKEIDSLYNIQKGNTKYQGITVSVIDKYKEIVLGRIKQKARKVKLKYIAFGVIILLVFSLLGFINRYFFLGNIVAIIPFVLAFKKEKDQEIEKIEKQLSSLGYDYSKNNYDLLDKLNGISEGVDETSKLYQKIDYLKEKLKSQKDLLKEYLINIGYKSKEDLLNDINKYDHIKQDTEINVDYNKILIEINNEKIVKEKEVIKLETIIEQFWQKQKSINEIEEEIMKEKDILFNIDIEKKRLNMALELIDEGAKRIQKNIIPKINSDMSEMLKAITDAKHSVLVTGESQELNTQVNNKNKNIWEFSDGTIDQMYLSLRLAITKVLSSEEKLPILIDESFSSYDIDRLKNTFKLLSEIAKENQVILFTCKEEEYNLAKSISSISVQEI